MSSKDARIDWSNRWAGDPVWDLVTFDLQGGSDFQRLLEGYEPDVPVAEVMEEHPAPVHRAPDGTMGGMAPQARAQTSAARAPRRRPHRP